MNQVKIGYYKKEDWQKLIDSSDDKDTMHSNWEDWNDAYNKLTIDLKHSGFNVVKIVVDIDSLLKYCEQNQLENTGAVRSQYIQQY